MKKVKIYNLGNPPTAPLDDFQELQEDFKLTDPDKLEKLINIIIKRGFKYAFKAWKDSDGKLWIIDAHQRKKALTVLQNRGYKVENIPYEPIFAENKKEAVEEIAAYNSEFGKKNPNTILFEKYDIDEETLDLFSLNLGTVNYDEAAESVQEQSASEISDSINTPEEHPSHKQETIELKPFKQVHVLISFKPERMIDIQHYLEKIKALDFVEYEQIST